MKTVFLITALSIGVLGVNLLGILWLAAKSGRMLDHEMPQSPSDESSPRRSHIRHSEEEVVTLDC